MAKQDHILDDNLDRSLQKELRLRAIRGEIYEGRQKISMFILPFCGLIVFLGAKLLTKGLPKFLSVLREHSFSTLFTWQVWKNNIGFFLGGCCLLILALIIVYYLMALWWSKKIVIVSPHQILQCYRPLAVARANVHLLISDITKFEAKPILNDQNKIVDYYVSICGEGKDISLFLAQTDEDVEVLKAKLEQMLGCQAVLV